MMLHPVSANRGNGGTDSDGVAMNDGVSQPTKSVIFIMPATHAGTGSHRDTLNIAIEHSGLTRPDQSRVVATSIGHLGIHVP